GLADGDRAVGGGVEVAALLGLVELRADRQGRFVPPEAAEDVGRPGRLLAPAPGNKVAEARLVEVLLHLEAVAAVARHRLVATDAEGPRGAGAVPLLAVRLQRQSLDRLAERHPFLASLRCGGPGLGVSLFRPWDLAAPDPDGDRPAPPLGHSVIGSVEDVLLDREPQLFHPLL